MRRRPNRAPRYRLLLIAALAISCDKPLDATEPSETVATITLDRSSLTLAVREYGTFTPTFKDVTGRTLIGVSNATWVSSDPTTASVDSTGLVAGLKFGGPVAITVSVDGVSAVADVTVKPIPIPPMQQVSLGVDSTLTFPVALADFYGVTLTTAAAAWTSSDPAVVRVNANGTLTGIAPGFANLTASYAGVPLSTQFEVGVPTLNDGTWTGSIVTGHPATMVVLFGTVRTFLSTITFPGACVAPYNLQGHAPVVANQFTLTLPYASTGTGTFSASGLSLSLSQLTPSVAELRQACPSILRADPVSASTMTMTRAGGSL